MQVALPHFGQPIFMTRKCSTRRGLVAYDVAMFQDLSLENLGKKMKKVARSLKELPLQLFCLPFSFSFFFKIWKGKRVILLATFARQLLIRERYEDLFRFP